MCDDWTTAALLVCIVGQACKHVGGSGHTHSDVSEGICMNNLCDETIYNGNSERGLKSECVLSQRTREKDEKLWPLQIHTMRAVR